MNPPAGVIAVTAVLGMIPALLPAQWLKYPTAGIPKTPSGLPNLGAPAPRTSDSKPDFSGIWEAENTAPCPADGCPDMPSSREFLNIGAQLPAGLPYQPWAAELVQNRMTENGKDDPVTLCQPAGALRLLTFPPFGRLSRSPG